VTVDGYGAYKQKCYDGAYRETRDPLPIAEPIDHCQCWVEGVEGGGWRMRGVGAAMSDYDEL